MIRESRALELLGVNVLWADRPEDSLWPIVPEKAELLFSEISPDEIQMADATYTLEQARIESERIMERLRRLGVQYAVPVKDGQRLSYMVPIH